MELKVAYPWPMGSQETWPGYATHYTVLALACLKSNQVLWARIHRAEGGLTRHDGHQWRLYFLKGNGSQLPDDALDGLGRNLDISLADRMARHELEPLARLCPFF